MSLCACLHSAPLLLSLLSSSTGLLAQQYCIRGTASETHAGDPKIGDPVDLGRNLGSKTESSTPAPDVVQLEIQSRWNGAAIQSKAASIAFTLFSRKANAVMAPVAQQNSSQETPEQALARLDRAFDTYRVAPNVRDQIRTVMTGIPDPTLRKEYIQNLVDAFKYAGEQNPSYTPGMAANIADVIGMGYNYTVRIPGHLSGYRRHQLAYFGRQC